MRQVVLHATRESQIIHDIYNEYHEWIYFVVLCSDQPMLHLFHKINKRSMVFDIKNNSNSCNTLNFLNSN